jgi:hypothetical protein
MGFDKYFENIHEQHGNLGKHNYPGSNNYTDDAQHSFQGEDLQQKLFRFLEKIKSDRKLKRLVILFGIVVLAILTVLLIVLMPTIIKLITYISQNGLQGVLESVTGFLDKIWKGSAK